MRVFKTNFSFVFMYLCDVLLKLENYDSLNKLLQWNITYFIHYLVYQVF